MLMIALVVPMASRPVKEGKVRERKAR